MALVPRVLRPNFLLRRAITRRGVIGGNPYLRPIAMILVGQGEFLRATAIRRGLMTGNPYWRVIGVVLLLRSFRNHVSPDPERLAVERIGIGRQLRVSVMEPSMTRRGRKAALKQLEQEALASVGSRSS